MPSVFCPRPDMAGHAARIYAVALRLAAALAVVGLLIFSAVKTLSPGGRLVVKTDFIQPSPFISEPKPSDRLAAAETDAAHRTSVPLALSPVYLDLTPTSAFDEVTMTVRYANRGGASLELGALISGLDGRFDLRPGGLPLLEALAWPRLTSGRLTLFERERRYASVDEFLRQPPELSQTATYLAAFAAPFRLAGYQPSGRMREVEVSLRGRQRLLTYVQNEPLNFSFDVQDMNREAGADPVAVAVYRLGEAEPVAQTTLNDDGNAAGDQRASKLRTVSVSLADPPAGAYQIEIAASSDIFIRRIKTAQSKLVFQDRLYLGDQVGYSDIIRPRTVYAAGRYLAARTPHFDGLQSLTVAGQTLELAEVQTRYVSRLSAAAGPVAVVAPRIDVILETDGLFALSREEYFNPLPLPLDQYATAAELEARGIDFILTSYEPPEAGEDGWSSATATFDADELARTPAGAYRFALVAPGIEDWPGSLRLADVTFTLERRPLTWRGLWSRWFGGAGALIGSGNSVARPDGFSFDESPL